MSTAKIPKKQQEILSLLKSSEDVIIKQGLIELRDSGADVIIPAVLDIFINSKDELLTEGLKSILFEIKSQNAVDHIFEVLRKDESKKERAFLVSIIWQAGLDASDYLSELVELAINNDYLTCLECLTVIENFETEFTEEEILQNLSVLKDATMSNNDNVELLHSMHEVIQNFIIG